MTSNEGVVQFSDEVLAAEYVEIKKRRVNAGQETSEGDKQEGVVGLACSGGGIRSASFSLGVIQVLIQEGIFKKIDYLSTVSGGGYTGSCISTLAQGTPGKEALLTERKHNEEPKALRHLRNYSQYLKSSGLFSGLRIPVLVIEGAIRSFFTFLPIVIFAVLLTEIFFEVTGRFSQLIQGLIPIVGIIPLLVMLAARPIFKHRLNWRGREKSDRLLTSCALWALACVVAIPLLIVLRNAVQLDGPAFFMCAQAFYFDHHWFFNSIGVVCCLGFVVGVIQLRWRMAALLMSLIAPLLIFSIYIFLCIAAINSPYIDQAELTEMSLERGDYATAIEVPLLSDEIKSFVAKQSLVDGLEASSCACGGEAADVTHYAALDRLLQSAFEQKQLEYRDFCISSKVSDKNEVETEVLGLPTLRFCRVMPKASTVEPDSNLLSMTRIKQLMTTKRPDVLTMTLVREVNTGQDKVIFNELRLLRGHAEWWLYLVGFLMQVYNWLFININRFSLHSFYRDKLSRTFLIKEKEGEIVSDDAVKLSELSGEGSAAPYHIINTALNLQGSIDPQLRSRKTVPYMLTKLFCGCDLTGYSATTKIEAHDPHFNLGAAMAISAAAAAPNMGTMGGRSLSFIMTLLNIRLNYWLPNPWVLNGKSADLKAKAKLKVNHNSTRVRGLGLRYLMSEALATVNEKTPYINCSDGGHIENLGVYELLRRQCKTIICIDAEADPSFNFNGLTTLQRYAEIDFGIVIAVDVNGIKPSEGLSGVNHVRGAIHYPDGSTGSLIYLKLSFTGSEPEYLHSYKQRNGAYPHESTSDQFFDETQFEVYRALGSFVAHSAKLELARL